MPADPRQWGEAPKALVASYGERGNTLVPPAQTIVFCERSSTPERPRPLSTIKADVVEPPHVGDTLYASCSAETVGTITRVGSDDNGTPVIDMIVHDYNEFLHFEDDDPAGGRFPNPPLTRFEVPEGTVVKLTNVQYVRKNPGVGGECYEGIECRTPQGGCYRCCYWFHLHRGGVRPE